VRSMANDDAYFKAHLARLRDSYTRFAPAQRFRIARERMNRLDAPANELIAVVSAAEGIARSLVVTERMRGGQKFDAVYKAVKLHPGTSLVKAIATTRGTTPEALVGRETWRLFGWACEYRNLLIHEATMLNQIDASWLIVSAKRVFKRITA